MLYKTRADVVLWLSLPSHRPHRSILSIATRTMETSYQQSSLSVPHSTPRKDQLPPYAGWSVSSTLTALDSSNMPATCDRHGLSSCGPNECEEATLDQDMIRDV